MAAILRHHVNPLERPCFAAMLAGGMTNAKRVYRYQTNMPERTV